MSSTTQRTLCKSEGDWQCDYNIETQPMSYGSSRVGLCQGEYPDFLMKAWLNYEYTNSKSNNDRPGEKHFYVVALCIMAVLILLDR